MPFGYVLAAALMRGKGNLKKLNVLFAVSFCFTISLIIELLQALMPSRSSHLLDLVLNTLGGLAGAVFYRFWLGVVDSGYLGHIRQR